MAKKIEKLIVEPAKVKTVKAATKTPAKPAAKKAAPKPVEEKSTFETLKEKAVNFFKGDESAEPTFEEIQTQAYYVAERRLAAGLPGDSASDWQQAEQELRAAKS